MRDGPAGGGGTDGGGPTGGGGPAVGGGGREGDPAARKEEPAREAGDPVLPLREPVEADQRQPAVRLAEALASELMYPLLAVRYDTLVGSFLGETSSRLRQLIEFAKTQRCVLFFELRKPA